MKNKLIYIMISILIIIGLSGTAVYFVFSDRSTATSGAPSIDDVVEYSVDVAEITTNLADGGYLKISFKIETSNKRAKEELTKRDFQTKDIVIGLLADMTTEDISGKEGQDYLKQTLKDHLNELMQEGKVVNIYITNSVSSK